jgi:hypothetical protein
MATNARVLRDKLVDNEVLSGQQPGQARTFSSVDWLTVTAMSDLHRDLLVDASRQTLQDLRSQRLPVKKWRFKGYSGWACEGFRTGGRKDSDIVMLSGLWATEYWTLFGPMAENCTRIDLAVTAELEKPDPALVETLWSKVPAKGIGNGVRLPEYTVLYNTTGGCTLYVGRRTSSQMGRVYDKGIESKVAPKGTIYRYEIEYKKPHSAEVLTRLLRTVHSRGIAEDIRGTVFNWFAARQVKPIFLDSGKCIVVDTHAKVTSDEVKLDWLTQQVRPSVEGLMSRGKIDEVIRALGLEQYVRQQQGAFGVGQRGSPGSPGA